MSLRRLHHRGSAAALVDAPLDFRAEVADEALDRPGRRVAKRADRVAFHLTGHFLKQVDLVKLRVAGAKPLHHPPHPARAFAAGRALATAFMLVEIADPADRADDVRGFVHDDRSEEHTSELQSLMRISYAVFCLKKKKK